MADNTRMKELQAKVETLFTLMDNNQLRFKNIEQSLATLSLIQQSLVGLSLMIEASQTLKPQGEPLALHLLVEDPSNITIHPTMDTYSVKNIKIDFPRFCRNLCLAVVLSSGTVFFFFNYYRVPNHHRVKIASVHFDGPVVPWFQRLQKLGKLTSWQVLTKSLECTYGP